jgi:hypothetical protein
MLDNGEFNALNKQVTEDMHLYEQISLFIRISYAMALVFSTDLQFKNT